MEQIIIRKLEDWQIFFRDLNKLQKQDRQIINKAIKVLETLKDNCLPTLGNEVILLNLLSRLKINNLDEALILLNTLFRFSSRR